MRARTGRAVAHPVPRPATHHRPVVKPIPALNIERVKPSKPIKPTSVPVLQVKETSWQSLARSVNRGQRAQSPKTSPAELLRLAKGKDVSVHVHLARNTALPREAFFQLKISDHMVALQVAGNHSAPPELLRTLSAEPHLRAEVARNSNTPVDVVEALTKDKDPRVAENARQELRYRQTPTEIITLPD